METARYWQIGMQTLRLDRPRVIGVLNVTPDSFSDGGRHASVAAAAGHAIDMIAQGADVIDVGGESTRPGAGPVDPAEQIDRTVPVIEAIRRETDTPISIDTTRAAVAAAALDAGADIINDVSAGTDDDAILDVAARSGCGLVLMHRRVRPDRDVYSDRYAVPPDYADVVEEVGQWLRDRCRVAESRGVDRTAIAIDAGLGFGKSVEQNFELIRRTGELAATGRPVLSAASRKSFIGAVTGEQEPARRVAGSIAVSVVHWQAGVRLFRVHDVAAHRQALAAAAAAEGVPAPV